MGTQDTRVAGVAGSGEKSGTGAILEPGVNSASGDFGDAKTIPLTSISENTQAGAQEEATSGADGLPPAEPTGAPSTSVNSQPTGTPSTSTNSQPTGAPQTSEAPAKRPHASSRTNKPRPSVASKSVAVVRSSDSAKSAATGPSGQAKAASPNSSTTRETPGYQESLKRQRAARRTRRLRTLKWVLIVAVIVLLVASIAGLWLVRNGLTDDTQAIQGTWRLEANGATITITEDKIILTDEVSYDYLIDPDSKTIAFIFGGLSGTGRYRFSLDQQQLAIADGNFDWFSTMVADIPWTASALADAVTGAGAKSPDLGDDAKLLERIE